MLAQEEKRRNVEEMEKKISKVVDGFGCSFAPEEQLLAFATGLVKNCYDHRKILKNQEWYYSL